MLVPIEAITTPAIVQSDAAVTLEIYSNKTFLAGSGRLVLRGDVNAGNYCFSVACSVVADVLHIPVVAPESTEDGTSDQTARYSAYFRIADQQPIPFLIDFSVPPLAPSQSSSSWARLMLHKAGVRTIPDTNTYTKRQVEELISMTAGGFLRAGLITYGISRFDVAPVDSADPVAVGANSPLLPQGYGRATLVGGIATVSTALVDAASDIVLVPQDADTSGQLHVENRVDGVSFDIVSSNFGDSGSVAWWLYSR